MWTWETQRSAKEYLIALALLIVAVLGAGILTPPEATSSFQAQNLEVLRSAQPGDVVICEKSQVPFSGSGPFLFVVSRRNTDRLEGMTVSESYTQGLVAYLENNTFLSDCPVALKVAKGLTQEQKASLIGQVFLGPQSSAPATGAPTH